MAQGMCHPILFDFIGGEETSFLKIKKVNAVCNNQTPITRN
jgi:hypothetical protein